MNFPVADPRLSALVSKVENGEILDLGSGSDRPLLGEGSGEVEPPARPRTNEIRAEWIRLILIGLPIYLPDEEVQGHKAFRAVRVTSVGIRIRSATITGVLDLDDLSWPGGAPLPPLHFEGCVFEERISLKRCHIRSLALAGCRFTELQAEEAVIEGPVKLSQIRRPTEIVLNNRRGQPTKSWGSYVVLRGAKIEGHVDCSRSSFAALPREDDEEPFVPNSKHPRFALDLRAAQIRGSVLLRPYVTACGGISFTLARVQGSVWCNGAELTAGEDCAFSADYAEIQGSLYLRTYDPPNGDESVRFVAKGHVSLFAAKIGGNLYMEGADLQRPEPQSEDSAEDDFQSLDATNATIGGNCKFSWWQSCKEEKRIYSFDARGKILLISASVRSDVLFWGANVGSVHANNISVGGNFDMSVYDNYRTLALVDNIERIRVRAIEVHLEGAAINGDLLMLGTKLGTEGVAPTRSQGLFARSAKIGGNCHLTTYPHDDGANKPMVRFECYGRIHVPEASIGNSLVMAGAKLIWKRPGADAVLDLSGTTIGGHAKFMTWQAETNGLCLPFEVEADAIALRLAGTKIAQKLRLNGAVITASKTAINAPNVEIGGKASLGCYKGCRFTASGGVILVAATIKLGLDMSGARLKAPLSLAPSLKAELRCKLVALDLTLARMRFVDFGRLEATGQVILKHAEIDTDAKLTNARFEGRVVADFAKVGASVDLSATKLWCGRARTIFEEILANTSEDVQFPEKCVRDELSRNHAGKQKDADLSLHSARFGGALIVRGLDIFQEYDSPYFVSMPGTLTYVTVDLRGLRVEELQDGGGEGWGKEVRLWLDGFRFARLNQLPHSLGGPSVDGAGLVRPTRSVGPSWLPAPKYRSDEVWKPRQEWLDLQYLDTKKPQMTEFTPDAYEQIVRTLNEDGLYEDARRIASEKITRERRLKPKWKRKGLWWLFWLCFEYGFSPGRALCTTVLCILLGWAMFHVADYGLPGFPNVGHAMVANRYMSEGVAESPVGAPSCGERINALLYALDVFVPVLDLRQQHACSISPDRARWQIAQALYAILGWLLIPLSLLTFSGILKRHLER